MDNGIDIRILFQLIGEKEVIITQLNRAISELQVSYNALVEKDSKRKERRKKHGDSQENKQESPRANP